MMTTKLRAGAFALALFGVMATAPASLAADPTGTWVTENGRSHVRVTNCGSALCGSIVWLKEPNDSSTGKPKTDKNNADESKRSRPLIGTPVVLSMKPNGADKWSGEVYNAEDGKTYSGNITMQGANTLRLEGCVMSFLCKGQTWTRGN